MDPLPSLFISHGAPTFALEPGHLGPALNAIGARLGRPEAVVVVSPHWMTPQPQVASSQWPETIHDFAGFDPALSEIVYPAPGHPALATRIIERLGEVGWPAQEAPGQGLDHGAWVPLRYLFPDADVPVVQVSLPVGLNGRSAFDFGRALAPLAKEGILLVGSGSLTHNLADFRMGSLDLGYVEEFAGWVHDRVGAGDAQAVMEALERAPAAQRAHPTSEHFLPLPWALGAAPALEPVTLVRGGIDHGMLAMDAFVLGADFSGIVSE